MDNITLDLSKLMTVGTEFTVGSENGIEFSLDSDDIKPSRSDSDDEESKEIKRLKSNYINPECEGVFDEDTYDDAAPFEVMKKKMVSLLPDGKIMKRVIRPGQGEAPNEYDSVEIHYNAYQEYEGTPFDSTYARKRPHRFTLNDGQVIAGLDFAVQTMKQGERSQFIIHPDYAYGRITVGAVRSNSTVLFEVELVNIIKSGATVTYQRLPKEQQELFCETYKYCLGLCEKAKKFFTTQQYKKAIRHYNEAACKLLESTAVGAEECEQKRALRLKLYSNLLLSYMKNDQPRKACDNAKKIYQMTQNGELLKIPAKVYFNHGKCQRILGDYDEAKALLEKARTLEPNNSDIAKEILTLDKAISEQRKRDLLLSKALVTKNN